MSVGIRRLTRIAEASVRRLHEVLPFDSISIFEKNHEIYWEGFKKTTLDEEFLGAEFFRLHGLTSREVQIEVVRVCPRLTWNKIHCHEKSDALILALGRGVGLPSPRIAKMYMEGKWFDIRATDQVIIPAGMPHGFATNEGGELYFLSIQSPPIVDEQGHDDFVIVKGVPPPDF